jgi:hypothetical protein
MSVVAVDFRAGRRDEVVGTSRWKERAKGVGEAVLALGFLMGTVFCLAAVVSGIMGDIRKSREAAERAKAEAAENAPAPWTAFHGILVASGGTGIVGAWTGRAGGSSAPEGAVRHVVTDVYYDAEGRVLRTDSADHQVDPAFCHSGMMVSNGLARQPNEGVTGPAVGLMVNGGGGAGISFAAR